MSNGNRQTIVQFGNNYIMQLKSQPGVLFWTCPLHIDADGHPKCYHPDGSPPGLDHLANAGKPGNWWGLACNPAGFPFIQKATDPAPGFYVSTTALEDPNKTTADPARYVDSGTWPYFVLPSKPKFDARQKLGDLAVIFNNKTGQCSWALYADIGPANRLGEGSMQLAAELGVDTDPKKGGTSQEAIAMIFWPGSRVAWPAARDRLMTSAWSLFLNWGGLDSARLALPQFNWDQFSVPEHQPDVEP